MFTSDRLGKLNNENKGRITVFALLLLISVGMTADAGTISGTVLAWHSRATRQFPFADAVVILFQTKGGSSNRFQEIARTYVGADGRYYFKGVEPGSYIIQVQGTNYPANVNAEYVELPAILVNLDSK